MVDMSDADDAHKRSERVKLDALLGWCEVTECRRRSLLTYFGEQLDADYRCGNCDVCLEPPEVFDGKIAGQKILSAVYRTGQRFGAVHIIDVLLGKATEKVRMHQHDTLSVYGVGGEYDANQWRPLISTAHRPRLPGYRQRRLRLPKTHAAKP